jgi:hypothetical protein
MSEVYGSARLRELLVELEETIVQAGGGRDLSWCVPGVSEPQVRAAFARIGLVPTGELITWFGWHNGSTGYPLLQKHFPRSLDELVTDYQRERDTDWLGEAYGQWRPGWVKIIGISHGIAADCNRPEIEATPVRFADPWDGRFDSDDPGAQPQPSMCVMVSWWIDAIRDGYFTWKPDTQSWDWGPPLRLPPERRALV